MKTLGIIGGIGPESTVDYYHRIIGLYREKRPDGSYPSLVINSIDMTRMLGMIGNKDFSGVSQYLAGEVNKLAGAGAGIGLMASNTPHIVFDEVRRQAQIPLISIVEATCEAIKTAGLKKVGLFGTRFTMQGGFYAQVLSGEGITVVTPRPDQQDYIHKKYMDELVNGHYMVVTRARLLEILDRMIAEDKIEGLILGGTELPLLLKDESYDGIPLLDTTGIHVQKAIDWLLS